MVNFLGRKSNQKEKGHDVACRRIVSPNPARGQQSRICTLHGKFLYLIRRYFLN